LYDAGVAVSEVH